MSPVEVEVKRLMDELSRQIEIAIRQNPRPVDCTDVKHMLKRCWAGTLNPDDHIKVEVLPGSDPMSMDIKLLPLTSFGYDLLYKLGLVPAPQRFYEFNIVIPKKRIPKKRIPKKR